MTIQTTIIALETLRNVARMVPVFGPTLEGVAEILIQGCRFAQEVKSNKSDSIALTERAALCTAAVVKELKTTADPEADMRHQQAGVKELLQLCEDIKLSNERRSQQKWFQRTLSKERDRDEIKDLQRALDQFIEHFGITSHIRTGESLAAIVESIEDFKVTQVIIMENQRKMAEAQTSIAASQSRVESSIITSENNALLATLKPVHAARYDNESAPPGCLQNTRVNIIQLITEWAGERSAEPIFWLSGPAGSGKSTIMRTVCEELARKGVLGASFFISTSSPERRDTRRIIQSIAHQLSRWKPVLHSHICGALKKNPDIIKERTDLQVASLIVEPISLAAPSLSHPIILLVDALDEAEKGEEHGQGTDLLSILKHFILDGSLANIKIIVASRYEPPGEAVLPNVKPRSLNLHQFDNDVLRQDLRLYYEHCFREIVAQRPFDVDSDWPGKDNIDVLLNHTGGLFIYASTVMKYVRNPRYLPSHRLKTILEQKRTDSQALPYSDLDMLYAQMLRSAVETGQGDEDLLANRLRNILGSIAIIQMQLSVVDLAELLGLDERVVYLDLKAISSVLILPERGSSDVVQEFHRSLFDFLMDPRRCTDLRFFVPPQEFHGLVVLRCLSIIRDHLYATKGKIPDHESTIVVYSQRWWTAHLAFAPINIIDKAIQLFRDALRTSASIAAQRRETAHILGHLLMRRFERAGEAKNLLEAIRFLREALNSCDPDHPLRHTFVNELALALAAQFERTGEVKTLTEAINLHREALTLIASGHSDSGLILNHLGNALFSLYNKASEVDSLVEAISCFRQALELRLPGHLLRDATLSNLGNALRANYVRTAEPSSLQEAIQCSREGLELCPHDRPARESFVNNLANILILEFRRTGEIRVLIEVIHLHREALDLQSPTHPNRDLTLSGLAHALHARFEGTGDVESLSESITLHKELLELRPVGHPTRGGCLVTYASVLTSQFDLTREIDTLRAAIELLRQALELHPRGHPARDTTLTTLGVNLRKECQASGNVSLLDEAACHLQEALELCPPGDLNRDSVLNSLALVYNARFEKMEDLEALSEAIHLHRETLSLRPPGNPDRGGSLYNLGCSLYEQGKRSGDTEVLMEAVRLHREAVDLCLPDHPNYLARKKHLFLALNTYAELTNDSHASVEANQLLDELIQAVQSHSSQ